MRTRVESAAYLHSAVACMCTTPSGPATQKSALRPAVRRALTVNGARLNNGAVPIGRHSTSSSRSRTQSMAPYVRLLRGDTGFLPDLLDRVLAHPRGHVGVHGLDGLAPCRLLVGRQFDEGDLSGFLHLRQRFVVFRLRD